MSGLQPGAPQRIPGAGRMRLQIACMALAVVGMLCIGGYILYNSGYFGGEPEAPVEPSIQPGEAAEPFAPLAVEGGTFYPTGKLFVTEERLAYRSGEMTLEIPRLDYSGPVLADVTDESLMEGIGLYDYSPPPGYAADGYIDNHNISIAGHRDLYGNEFYYIDTITEGDPLYLYYNGKRYTYTYRDTAVIESDDWSVIYCTDTPTLTLTSCEPIGVADKRIIVRADLTDISEVQ